MPSLFPSVDGHLYLYFTEHMSEYISRYPCPESGEMLMHFKPHTLTLTDTHTMSFWGHVNTSFYSLPDTIRGKK